MKAKSSGLHGPALDASMGERPENRTLDRINVNGNYAPSNCRWATRKEQAMNTQKSASKLGAEVEIPDELCFADPAA